MSWVDALGERAGPLADAARRFSKLYMQGQPLPRGGDAIAAIADAIDALAHDPSAPDDADTTLIETAGALFALVLLDRYPGRHAARERDHRVLLGAWGSFDPFAAIDQALDAEEPFASFRDSVAAAEAEALGRGPVSRVVRAFCELSGRTLAERFELEVVLEDGIEVDLRSVFRATSTLDQAAVDRAVAKVVALLEGSSRTIRWEDACDRILPRLVGPTFVESAQQANVWLAPWAEDVSVALQLRFEGRMRYVRESEVDAWVAEGARPVHRAVERLAARSESARFARIDLDEGVLVVARTGDGLDAARALLPGLSAVLEPELGHEIWIAVPHRDTLLASANESLLRRHADDAYRRAPHPISREPVRLD